MPTGSELTSLAAVAPALETRVVAEAVEEQFGLTGDYTPLVSERDQNFLLRVDDGERYVAKVVNEKEDPLATEFQIMALRHLEGKPGLRVPGVYPSVTGETTGNVSQENDRFCLRVLTWVSGEPLETRGIDPNSGRTFGTALARLDRALEDFAHPGDTPVLAWDLQRVTELRALVGHIGEGPVRDRVEQAIDDYEEHVLPSVGDLRTQVIHSDANPGNVLIRGDEVGFIDFGDMVRAPLVFELAIAASYLRAFDGDALRYMAPFVQAFHAAHPLGELEAGLLFDLVRARLATTVTTLYWRLDARAGDDPYRQKALETERGAERYLALLDALGRTTFRNALAILQ